MREKPLRWLHGEVSTPPVSVKGRKEIGYWLGQAQIGVTLSMPLSRPMPEIGARCHELRVRDEAHNWRIIYRIDEDVIVVAEVFAKTTETTPKHIIAACQKRLRDYDAS